MDPALRMPGVEYFVNLPYLELFNDYETLFQKSNILCWRAQSVGSLYACKLYEKASLG